MFSSIALLQFLNFHINNNKKKDFLTITDVIILEVLVITTIIFHFLYQKQQLFLEFSTITIIILDFLYQQQELSLQFLANSNTILDFLQQHQAITTINLDFLCR